MGLGPGLGLGLGVGLGVRVQACASSPASGSSYSAAIRRTEQLSASEPAARIAAVSHAAPNEGPRS